MTTTPRPGAYLTPNRRAIFLVAGDKAGRWSTWYRDAISLAETRYTAYRTGMDKEAGS